MTGEIGQMQSFYAQAAWTVTALGRAPVAGTITSIDLPEDGVIDSGTVALGIDLRPMVVMPGPTPAFRDLASGARGADVAQLREHLVESGYLATVGEDYDAATTRAVRAWQRDLGYPVDGVVHLGDVLFLADLPVRAAIAVEVGMMLSPGDELITVVDVSFPILTVPLTGEQVNLVPQTGDVVVSYAGHTWVGVIAASLPQVDGSVLLTLGSGGGGALCGADCDVIPLPGPVNVPVDIVVTPVTTGLVVPVAAITTTAGATTVVTTADGTRLEVTVVAIAKGFAVVDGIEAGLTVRVPSAGE